MTKTEKSPSKSRVSYSAELRAAMKDGNCGLLTISLTLPNGERLEEQGTIDVLQCQFAKWAMVALFCPEVRELPDLEQTIKQLMNRQP